MKESGHVMAAAHVLFANDPLSTASMEDTVWPSRAQFLQHNLDQFASWLSRWKLPAFLQAYWRTFLQEEWDNHASQVGNIPKWDVRRVQQFKRLLDGWVLTPADHFSQVLHMACPQHYDFLLRRTFEDPQIFTECYNPSIVIRSKILENFPKCLTEYTWAVNWHGRLPGAYVLPKPSKSFSKARPIITYAGSCASILGRLLGTCLLSMLLCVFGSHASLPVQSILREVWRCMRRIPVDVETVGRQQDLIGFFNSVPHRRIQEDVEYVVHRYCVAQGVSIDSVLHAHQNQKERVQRIFQGKYGAKKFMLHHSFFQLGRQVYRQHLGPAMGSQWSPVLCAIVAATREHMFYTSLLPNARMGEAFEPFRSVCRYVDNRYMVYVPGAEKHPIFPLWTDLEFIPAQFYWRITFLQPAMLSKLRSVQSAGSMRYSMAGFQSRALLIARFVRPRCLIPAQIADLLQQYRWKGIACQDFVENLRSLERRFQIPLLRHDVLRMVR